MTLRAPVVLIVALIAGLAAIWSAGDGSIKRMTFPGHADVDRAELMTRLGQVAAKGGDPAILRRQAIDLSHRNPLDDAPFLVSGAIDEQAGRAAVAEALYRAALFRNPRSQGAHFMLASRALAQGDADRSLRHLASLARQTPGAGVEFSKLMVAVAREPAFDGSIRRFMAREPHNRDLIFQAMAADPALTARLMELAPPVRSGPPPAWLPALIRSELNVQRVDGAALAWMRYGGGVDPRSQPLRDGQFTLAAPPPPFGWQLLDNDSGAAAANAPGLDVETYGRSSQGLITQWLLLTPGSYRLTSIADATVAPALEWHVQCLPPVSRTQATLPVGRSAIFAIPPDCRAQSIDLWTRNGGDGRSASGKLKSVALERLP